MIIKKHAKRDSFLGKCQIELKISLLIAQVYLIMKVRNRSYFIGKVVFLRSPKRNDPPLQKEGLLTNFWGKN